jgi:hypothetical protein
MLLRTDFFCSVEKIMDPSILKKSRIQPDLDPQHLLLLLKQQTTPAYHYLALSAGGRLRGGGGGCSGVG